MRQLHALLLLALPACAPLAEPGGQALPDPVPPLASLADKPQLALLESVLRDYFAADIANRPTICAAMHDGREAAALAVEDERALMERFPTLAPMRRCIASTSGWTDGENGEAALVFSSDSFACASATSCTGRAGTGGGTRNLYALDWREGRWTIARQGPGAP